MKVRTNTWLIALALVSLTIHAGDAFARAGSGGSRGSRSYSAPARPSSPASPSNPSSPSRQLGSPTSPAPQAQPSRGWMGGLMGGLAGFALGGLLGGLLFGGLGHGFGGIGMFDIMLIGLGLFLLYRFMSARRAAQSPQPAYATAGAYGGGSQYAGGGSQYAGGGVATAPAEPVVTSDLDRGIAHIRQMDAGFDPDAVAQTARALFGDVQRAMMARDMSAVSSRLTSRMFTELGGQCDRLRAARHQNHVDQTNVRRAEVSEAWQESGQDFVTVYLAGTLVDYTVDEVSGGLVEGSRTPQDFEEFWTFTRPVGPNGWKLSAIQSS